MANWSGTYCISYRTANLIVYFCSDGCLKIDISEQGTDLHLKAISDNINISD
jgi:hypothetical protein